MTRRPVLWMLVGVGCLAAAGCRNVNPPGGRAEIAVVSQAATASDVVRVEVTVTGADMSPIVVQLRKTSGIWRGIIGQIPAGPDRTFRADAYDAGDTLIFTDEVTADVIANQLIVISFFLQEVVPPSPPMNYPPTIISAIATSDAVEPGGAIGLQVNAVDPEGQAVTISYSASAGSFSPPTGAMTTWTAPATEGVYQLTASAKDDQDLEGVPVNVNITVTQAAARGRARIEAGFNAWPKIQSLTATPTSVAPGGQVSLGAVASDPESDPLGYAWGDNCGGTFAGGSTANPTWTAPSQDSACILSVIVTDGRGGSDEKSTPVSVGAADGFNLAPVIAATYAGVESIEPGGVVPFEVQAYDPEGAAVTYAWTGPAGGTFDDATQPAVLWTAPTAAGTYTVSAAVSDPEGAQSVADFSICVQTTCAAEGKTCGSISDGCGGTLTCGTCAVAAPSLPAGAYPGRTWAVNGTLFAWFTDSDGTNVPTAWLYKHQAGQWTLDMTLADSWPNDVFAPATNDIWVSAFYCPGGGSNCGPTATARIYHYDGTGWNVQTLPGAIGQNQVTWVRGTPGNIHAAFGGGVIRYDGSSWSHIYTVPGNNQIYTPPAQISANEMYSATCWGHHQWDGTNWFFVSRPTAFCDVGFTWGVRDGQGALHLYAAGNQNFSNCMKVWQYQEGTGSWDLVHSACSTSNCGSATGLWGSSGSDVYVGAAYYFNCAGMPGEVHHFDGTSWSPIGSIGSIPNPSGITGTGPSDVWVGLQDNSFLHFTP